MDKNKIREKATEDWKKFAPTFGTNPYFISGYIAGYERALAELSSVLQANELLPPVSGSLPHVIYVEQGNSSIGKDLEGREYYIKHVSGNDR